MHIILVFQCNSMYSYMYTVFYVGGIVFPLGNEIQMFTQMGDEFPAGSRLSLDPAAHHHLVVEWAIENNKITCCTSKEWYSHIPIAHVCQFVHPYNPNCDVKPKPMLFLLYSVALILPINVPDFR